MSFDSLSQKGSEVDRLLDVYKSFIGTHNIVGSDWSESHFDIVNSGEGNIDIVSCCAVQNQAKESSSGKPTCWGLTFAELRESQHQDKALEILMTWLEQQETPSEKDLFISSPEVKNHWLNKAMFQLVEGVLFRRKPTEDERDLLLVIPDSLKNMVMSLHHDIPSSGHQGVARTKAKLKEKFYWFRLSRDAESYVLTCSVCNQNKKTKAYGRVPLTEYQAGAPMERVHIDFIGPLP